MSKGKKLLYTIMTLIGLVFFFWCALPVGLGIIHIGMIIPMIFGLLLAIYCLLSIKFPMEDIPYKNQQDVAYKTKMAMAKCQAGSEKRHFRKTILFGLKEENLEEYDEQYESNYVPGMLISREARELIDKIVWIVVGVLAAVFIGMSILMATGYERYEAPYEGQTVVTLGCKVNGEQPSRQLKLRLEATLEFLEENPDAKCIVTGGQGSNEVVAESKVMAAYLEENGIAADRIYQEDKATNTKENIQYAKKLAAEDDLNQDFIIITEDYHEYRANSYAKELGINSVGYSAKCENGLWLSYWCREMFAIIRDAIF